MGRLRSWFSRRSALVPKPPAADALRQLEREDRVILHILDEFDSGGDPLGRGEAGTLLVDHLALRGVAREHVIEALVSEPATAELAEQMARAADDRRLELSRLDDLARGLRAINLNQGEDFDAAVAEVSGPLREEIRSDLDDIVPFVRRRRSREVVGRLVPGARATSRRARQALASRGPHRSRRAWGASRLRTMYGRLRRRRPEGRDDPGWTPKPLGEPPEDPRQQLSGPPP